VSAQKTQKKRPAPAVKRGRNQWVFPAVLAGVVVVGILAVVLVAAGGDDGDAPGGKEAVTEVSAEVAVEGTTLPAYSSSGLDGAVGDPAPTIGSVNFQGGNVSAGGATGSPYALVFLAHYCPHCQTEVPRLVALARNGQIEGVDVIGVTTGTTDQAPNYPPSEWLAREDWDFPVLLDDNQGSAGEAFGLRSYPFFVFVDADGNVAGRISGEISEEDLTVIFRALANGEQLPLPGVGASTTK
jgi:cytochrome c biogenesis protein CcmG/thiol:disulfide interchange protein DsbE